MTEGEAKGLIHQADKVSSRMFYQLRQIRGHHPN